MARKRRTVAGPDDPRRLTDPRNIPIEYNNIEVTVDNLERLAEDILFDCCQETDTDPTEIPPSIWLYTLLEINEKLFRGNKSMLKKHPAEHDEYNAERVLKAYEVYKKLCVKHKQQITIKGFSDMTGINTQTIYNWDSDSKYNAIGYGSSSETLSKRALDLAKTISIDNEQSLEALLLDKSINPVKPLAILNRNHLWNMPGVTRETATKRALSADQLPQLGRSEVCKIDQNDTKSSTFLEAKKDAQKPLPELVEVHENEQ